MRTKPIYLYRIADRAYFIYRLSNYARMNIDLIHAGVAFDNTGNFTTKLKSLIKKYNLNEYFSCTHVTSTTFDDFCDSIYLNSKQEGITASTIPIPSKVFEMVQSSFIRRAKQDQEKEQKRIDRYLFRNGYTTVDPDILSNEDKKMLEHTLRQLRSK